MNNLDKYSVVLSLSFTLNAYSLGLGDMKVSSSLNQPFDAEIALIDVNDIPLSGIKSDLASVEDFERVGLERVYALSELTFSVGRNNKGKPVIKIRSDDRMTEPYLQILVDLAWANGQVYRSYTVLLDPPDYQIALDKTNIAIATNKNNSRSRKTGVVEKPVYNHVEHNVDDEQAVEDVAEITAQKTYGPVLENETVWQIAQRYKTDEHNLPQVILSIVGMNPEAFSKDNLNGLRVGSRLKIPAQTVFSKVNKALAKEEVQAHDIAWRDNIAIQHVLLPPYYEKPAVLPEQSDFYKPSHLVSLDLKPGPSLDVVRKVSQMPSVISEKVSLERDKQVPQTSRMKTEMDIAAQAIDSIRQTNDLLKKQIIDLQTKNESLQERLQSREQMFTQLQQQVQALTLRQGVAGQVVQGGDEESNTLWWILILVLIAGGGGGAYWWFIWRVNEAQKALRSAHSMSDAPKVKAIEELERQAVSNGDNQKHESQTSSQTVTHEVDKQQSLVKPVKKPNKVAEAKEKESKRSKQDEPQEKENRSKSNQTRVEAIDEKVPQEEKLDSKKDSNDAPLKEHGNLKASPNKPAQKQTTQEVPPSITEPQGLEKKPQNDSELKPDALKENKSSEDSMSLSETSKQNETPMKSSENQSETEIKNDKNTDKKIKNEDNSIDFTLEPIEPAMAEDQPKESIKTSDAEEHILEFETNEDKNTTDERAEVDQHDDDSQNTQIETLLELSETYIDMGDIDAAKQSLEEVISKGTKQQIQAAQALLDKLK